jgi:REP element-mobilizing transposase RayT
MARPFRIQFDGAFYHVMNRGRNKALVFHSDNDYGTFIKGLVEAHDRFKAKFHAFCLMPNHYHLFIETPSGNLSRIMRHINGAYTQRYHKNYGTDGTIFKGRYKSILVDSDHYAADLVAYIHNNPINCKQPLVQRLEDYEWSSFNTYLGKSDQHPWVYTELANSLYQKKSDYNIHKENAFTDFYSKCNTQYVIGTKKFKQMLIEKYCANDINKAKHIYGIPKIEKIVTNIANVFNVSENDLLISNRGRKQVNLPRKIAILMSQELGNCSHKKIQKHFNLNSESSVEKVIRDARDSYLADNLTEISINLLKNS